MALVKDTSINRYCISDNDADDVVLDCDGVADNDGDGDDDADGDIIRST